MTVRWYRAWRVSPSILGQQTSRRITLTFSVTLNRFFLVFWLDCELASDLLDHPTVPNSFDRHWPPRRFQHSEQRFIEYPHVRFGSLADLLLNTSLMSASGRKADVPSWSIL